MPRAIDIPVLLLPLLLASCRGAEPARSSGPAGDHAFEISCAGSSTHTSGQAQCIRTDTRTGDIVRVDISRLPVSNGRTEVAAAPVGRYQTACVAVNMAERSDFYCLRLDTESGEIMLVNLLKIPTFPASAN
jgi:hypothetical protein